MNPADIASKRFTTVRLRQGYDETEVDDFLDEVQAAYTQVLRDLNDANVRLNQQPTQYLPPVPAATPAPVPSGPTVESVGLLLTTAQQTADQITAKANDEAAAIIAQARADAAQIAAEAQTARNAAIGELEVQRQALADKVTALNAAQADAAAKLQAALNGLGGTA